jgi:hypothetical protein
LIPRRFSEISVAEDLLFRHIYLKTVGQDESGKSRKGK